LTLYIDLESLCVANCCHPSNIYYTKIIYEKKFIGSVGIYLKINIFFVIFLLQFRSNKTKVVIRCHITTILG